MPTAERHKARSIHFVNQTQNLPNLNLKKTRVLREPVECAPCQLKVCPIDHRCMTRLLPERVVRERQAGLRHRE